MELPGKDFIQHVLMRVPSYPFLAFTPGVIMPLQQSYEVVIKPKIRKLKTETR